jgi:hypothetical protein
MRATALYADGWVAQMRLPAEDTAARQAAYEEALGRMRSEMEAQLASQGYYVPFGPLRLVVARKTAVRECVGDGN